MPLQSLEALQEGIDKTLAELAGLRNQMAEGKLKAKEAAQRLQRLHNQLAKLKAEKLRTALRKLHRISK